MYTVLLPVKTERSLAAADHVADLPEAETDVEVVVVSVFEEFEVSDEGGVVRSADLYEESDIPAVAGEVADRLEREGIGVTVRREHGDPATTICDLAADLEVDAIAMAGRRRSPTGKAVFGSVVQGVLLESDRPVTVVTRD